MSQSPTEATDRKQLRQYFAGWRAYQQMIDNGKSISGRERHCCFLNTGEDRYADVSSVTGLDFVDDGRAVALTDWDHDGDQDIWIKNRTGPSVRFLRNDMQTGNHFLSVRLVGRDCNRDAVGARVELFTADGDRPHCVKTLRAGSGFLSQSSKWLHFGLGNSDRIDRLVVRWPGGKAEEYRGLEVDNRIRILQGARQPVEVVERRKPLELVSKPTPTTQVDAGFRVFAMPGSRIPVRNVDPGPMLVTLWAGWCQPCLAELKELSERSDEIRDAGLQVLAVNVDGVKSPTFDSKEADAVLDKLGFPFPSTDVDAKGMDVFERVRREVMARPGKFALPTSFLVDQYQNVRLIYGGRLKVDQLLSDLTLLPYSPEETRDVAVPFPGKWLEPPPVDSQPH